MAAIDPETGALTLDDGTRLDPDTTKARFLGSALGKGAREGVQNEPWSSWVVPALSAGGRAFRAMLCFCEGRIGMIDLVLLGAEYGKGWQDVSAEKELARKAAHDAWLESQLGAPSTQDARSSTWTLGGCEVVSLYDARAIASAIHLRYGWEKDEGDEEG